MGFRIDQKENMKRARDPEVGDLWQEMLSYWIQITNVTDTHVEFVDLRTGDTVCKTRAGFVDWVQYDSKSMQGKTWIDFFPSKDAA